MWRDAFPIAGGKTNALASLCSPGHSRMGIADLVKVALVRLQLWKAPPQGEPAPERAEFAPGRGLLASRAPKKTLRIACGAFFQTG